MLIILPAIYASSTSTHARLFRGGRGVNNECQYFLEMRILTFTTQLASYPKIDRSTVLRPEKKRGKETMKTMKIKIKIRSWRSRSTSDTIFAAVYNIL